MTKRKKQHDSCTQMRRMLVTHATQTSGANDRASSAGETLIVGSVNPVEMKITANSYRVMVKGRSGADICIGSVCRSTSYASGERVEGWRFMPQTQAHPSRKVWPTPEAALKGRVKDYQLVANWPESSSKE